MLTDSKVVEKRKFNIPTIQKYIFFLILFVAPFAIIPFPWDWTERGMSLLILGLSTIIVVLELIKLVWEGKVTFLKSILDGGIIAILVSMIISTLFSKDINSSLWGADGRLGGGIIVFVAILLVCICARTFIKNIKDVKYALLAFVAGFTITNILSILSFLGVNVWGFIPVYKDLGQAGLPLLRSSKTHLFVNFILMLINTGFLADFLINREGKKAIFTITLIASIVSSINIWIFSINQGIGLIILFVLLAIALWFFGVKKLKITKVVSKDIMMMGIGIILFVLIPTIVLQIPALRTVIIPKSISLVAQVSLGSDVSWIIAASVFVASFARGLFGMGVDTYSIAYNLYKPLNQNLLQYNGVNFYYGGSELFTQFSNGGLVWLIAWGFFGFLILKMIRRDLGKAKIYKDEINNIWLLIVLDITILFIFLSSIFAVYSVLVILLLIVMIAMRSVILEILSKGTEEKFVIKLWTANLKPENELGKSAYNINIVLTVVIICLGLGTLGLWVSKTIASAYLLKAESFYIEQNKKYENLSPSIEERQTFINSMTYYYATASKYDGNNPIMNRKTGSMYLELVGISAEKYSKDAGDSTQNAALISDVGKWKNYALDYTRKSIDTNPAIYSNWETRAQVYMGLVGMGFKDYASDSLFSLQKAAELNPLNYDLYYSEAQVYLVSGDKDSALASLTKVLGINAQHIPSLVLAGDINNQKGNTAIYESYLKAAKKILETTSQTNTDVYKEITNKLNDITNKGTTETAK
jgi:hypothetical protein